MKVQRKASHCGRNIPRDLLKTRNHPRIVPCPIFHHKRKCRPIALLRQEHVGTFAIEETDRGQRFRERTRRRIGGRAQ